MSESVKLTLSIPKALRERMGKFDESVNWSEMARELFERRVAMLEQTKTKLSAETLARLKASEEREADEDLRTGRDAGRGWAEKEAEMSELRALARYSEESGAGITDDPGDEFFSIVDPQGDLDRNERREFWQLVYGADAPSAEFVQAFVNGALEVLELYDEAK